MFVCVCWEEGGGKLSQAADAAKQTGICPLHLSVSTPEQRLSQDLLNTHTHTHTNTRINTRTHTHSYSLRWAGCTFVSNKSQIKQIWDIRLGLRITIRWFIGLTIRLRAVNHRAGFFQISSQSVYMIVTSESHGWKANEIKQTKRNYNFHSASIQGWPPAPLLRGNSCKRQRDPAWMLKCQSESKVCVCSVRVCVMYYISSRVAALTGWPCRTCAALDALKSPCRVARASVTDNQGAAVAVRRNSSARIQQWFKVVHVLRLCQLYFWDQTNGLAAYKLLEGTHQNDVGASLSKTRFGCTGQMRNPWFPLPSAPHKKWACALCCYGCVQPNWRHYIMNHNNNGINWITTEWDLSCSTLSSVKRFI